MPESVRLAGNRVSRELERLGVVLNASGMKFDARKNVFAKYSRVLEPEFLADNVVAKIRAELMAEVEAEMLKDPRTAILIQGKDGRQISEKRTRKGGNSFRKVPKLDDGSHKNSPVRVEIKTDRDGEVRMRVSLNHPLYVVMHSGTRPHEIRPFGGIHVFPTAEAIASNPKWANTPYAAANLKSLPWRDPNDKSVRFKIAYPAPISAFPRSGPNFGRTGNTGFGAPHPFLSISWKRVTRRLRSRYLRILTRRMREGI